MSGERFGNELHITTDEPMENECVLFWGRRTKMGTDFTRGVWAPRGKHIYIHRSALTKVKNIFVIIGVGMFCLHFWFYAVWCLLVP